MRCSLLFQVHVLLSSGPLCDLARLREDTYLGLLYEPVGHWVTGEMQVNRWVTTLFCCVST